MIHSPALLLHAEAVRVGWAQPLTEPLSFALGGGEIVGLLGPNGVGKSTLLAAIAGRAQVFAGQLERAPGVRFAWQTQEVPAVLGLPISGRDLLALSGAGSDGLPPWLSERLDQRLDQLSGGQRHYLALWAVVQSPADLLLLDEPTNNLDRQGVEHLVTVLRQRAAAGLGILVVSHDHEFVDAVCGRTMTLEQVLA